VGVTAAKFHQLDRAVFGKINLFDKLVNLVKQALGQDWISEFVDVFHSQSPLNSQTAVVR
jgi:hypothetical protein